jgi:5-methylcytosine-specific restriction protein A
MMCGEKATETHHKKAMAIGGTDDDENLVALCKPCHDKIDGR